MAILDLRIAPDPILSTRAAEVADVTDDIRQLLDDMVETMYANDGAGLAANQVGVLKRVLVVDVARSDEPPNPMKFINPVITYQSAEKQELEEGCLSVPDFWYKNSRPDSIKVDYLDEHGHKQHIEAQGYLAYALHHEIDHLDGKLYIEYLSSFKQRLILNKLRKNKKMQERRG